MKLEDEQGKTMPAIDVFSESIKYLKNHLFRILTQRVPELEEKDIKWVLTVPAIWEDAAKEFMTVAAEKVVQQQKWPVAFLRYFYLKLD